MNVLKEGHFRFTTSNRNRFATAALKVLGEYRGFAESSTTATPAVDG